MGWITVPKTVLKTMDGQLRREWVDRGFAIDQ